MSPGPNAPSSIVETDGAHARGSDPQLMFGLAVAKYVLIPLFFLSLTALLRRRWKTLAVLSATWLFTFLPFLGIKEQFIWIRAQGFALHASPLEDYLSRCKLIEFVENSVKQAVCPCEGSWTGDVENTVFYDTSGEFVLPVSRRTPEWKKAMQHFTPREVLIDSEDRAEHIVGKFYLVSVHIREMTGDDGR